jgi:hypothetical protein
MQLKKMLLAALVLMVAVAGANLVHAASWSQYGKVKAVYSTSYDYTYSDKAYSYIYLEPVNSSGLGAGYTQYCRTNNPTVIQWANSAAGSNETVRMYCSGTFPTSGTYRWGGYVKYFNTFPGY